MSAPECQVPSRLLPLMKCPWLWRPPHMLHWPSQLTLTPLAPQPLTFKDRLQIGGARQSSGQGRQGSLGRAARTKPGDRRPPRQEARPFPEPAGEARARPGPSPGERHSRRSLRQSPGVRRPSGRGGALPRSRKVIVNGERVTSAPNVNNVAIESVGVPGEREPHGAASSPAAASAAAPRPRTGLRSPLRPASPAAPPSRPAPRRPCRARRSPPPSRTRGAASELPCDAHPLRLLSVTPGPPTTPAAGRGLRAGKTRAGLAQEDESSREGECRTGPRGRGDAAGQVCTGAGKRGSGRRRAAAGNESGGRAAAPRPRPPYGIF